MKDQVRLNIGDGRAHGGGVAQIKLALLDRTTVEARIVPWRLEHGGGDAQVGLGQQVLDQVPASEAASAGDEYSHGSAPVA